MTRNERIGRQLVYLQALGVAAGYISAVALVDIFYVHHHIPDPGLAFGYSFCLVEGVIITVLLALSLIIKFVRHSREATWVRLQPLIVAKTSAYLTGADVLDELRQMRRHHPREMEMCISELLLRVQGTARIRLSGLALELGMVHKWVREYRSRRASRRRDAISRLGILDGGAGTPTVLVALKDPNDEVKLEASRALLRNAEPAQLAAVFHTAVQESLLVRAVLTESLRPHALLLCEAALPEALASEEPRIVRIALEIVRAWKKALPVDCVQELLRHSDPGVRGAAFAILPQLVAPREFEAELLEAINDESEVVRSAAAEAAGKIQLASALPALKKCLEMGGAEGTIAAAYALARIGPQGCGILEGQVLSSRSTTASAALEALEMAHSERLMVAI